MIHPDYNDLWGWDYGNSGNDYNDLWSWDYGTSYGESPSYDNLWSWDYGTSYGGSPSWWLNTPNYSSWFNEGLYDPSAWNIPEWDPSEDLLKQSLIDYYKLYGGGPSFDISSYNPKGINDGGTGGFLGGLGDYLKQIASLQNILAVAGTAASLYGKQKADQAAGSRQTITSRPLGPYSLDALRRLQAMATKPIDPLGSAGPTWTAMMEAMPGLIDQPNKYFDKAESYLNTTLEKQKENLARELAEKHSNIALLGQPGAYGKLTELIIDEVARQQTERDKALANLAMEALRQSYSEPTRLSQLLQLAAYPSNREEEIEKMRQNILYNIISGESHGMTQTTEQKQGSAPWWTSLLGAVGPAILDIILRGKA